MKNSIYNIDFLNSIISDNPFGRYMEDKDLYKKESIRYAVDCTYKLVNIEGVEALPYVNRVGTIEGLIIFRISDWDTAHFERKTAIIEHILAINLDFTLRRIIINSLLADFYAWCKSHNIKFVTAKISSVNLTVIHALEKIGFNFIESWIYNKYNLNKHEANSVKLLELRHAEEADLDYMLKFSENAFSTHRFHADINIPYAKAETLYHKWIKTSFADKNQKILVYEHNGIPSAFMIYYLKDLSDYFNLKFAMWKMVLLNPDIKGQGIGTRFFKSLFNYHKSEGCDVVDSGLSLRNIVSLNTHNKVNFKVISTLANFHLWL